MERISIYDNSRLKTILECIALRALRLREGERVLEVKPGGGTTEGRAGSSQTLNSNDTSTKSSDVEDGGLLASTAPGIIFPTEQARLEHYKSDWHRWNLKLRAAGRPPLTKVEFEFERSSKEKTSEDDADGEDESGSSGDEKAEKDPDEEIDRAGASKVSFDFALTESESKQVEKFDIFHALLVWKALIAPLPPRPRNPQSLKSYFDALPSLLSMNKVAIFMASGGRFAAAIFVKGVMTLHKTVQRYTVRRKQGGSQSSKDNQSAASQPKSAGATIRRQQEVKFKEDILAILTAWKDTLATCQRVFLAAPSHNKLRFYNEVGFAQDDVRVRSVPFTTSRPTLAEVQRIHLWLTTVELKDEQEKVKEAPVEEAIPVVTSNPFEGLEEVEKEEEEVRPDVIAEAIEKGDLSSLQQLIENEEDRPSTATRSPVFLAVQHKQLPILEFLLGLGTEDIDSIDVDWFSRTPLHRACHDGQLAMIELLLDKGADPTVHDIQGKTPYQLSANKEVKEALRLYAGSNPSKWNWSRATIDPLTPEQVEAQKAKAAEQRKKKKVAQKEKKKDQKEEEERAKEAQVQAAAAEAQRRLAIAASVERVQKMAALTDREKRARAAEMRFKKEAGGATACEYCGQPLQLLVPFERLAFKYCSTACVLAHKQLLDKAGFQ